MSNPKIVAIIQARMGSSRLPGKVLLDLAGKPVLQWVIERTGRATLVDTVMIATTTEPGDDPVVEFCHQHGYACTRGSLHDVLDRYYQAARLFKAEVIVRITADCPLIDPALIDLTVGAFLGRQPIQSSWKTNRSMEASQASPFDFVANRLPPPWGRTYPIGLDTEVCSFEALQTAWNEAQAPHQREHVMPFFYDHQERFRILLVNHSRDYGSLRWTVDTPDDLKLVRQICTHFPGRDDFSWLEIVELIEHRPELTTINAGVTHKDYRQVDTRR